MTSLEGLVTRGFAFVDLGAAWRSTPEGLRERAALSPHAFAAELLGVDPLLVERQPVRPIEGARAFAGSREVAPLHTDSQLFLGVPAAVQILVCVRAAPAGGGSVLVDGAELVARLDREDPALGHALFAEERAQRFYFGEVTGPTVSSRGGHVTFTVAPRAPDPVGVALGRALDRACREHAITHTLRPGEALVASNHRMLHGREPFTGERELVRLLVWLEEPLAGETWPDAATRARTRVVVPPAAPEARVRLRAVLGILRGVPPAKAARDAGVDEATLYAWRDAFFRP